MEHLNQLSRREKDVADLVLQGKSNKQIAWLLGISVNTVEFHLKNIYTRLHVTSRIELVLKLGNVTRNAETGTLGFSVVDGRGEEAQDDCKSELPADRAGFFRKIASWDGSGPRAGRFVTPKYVLVATMTVLFSGLCWAAVFAIFLGKAAP